jgi:Fic family protein
MLCTDTHIDGGRFRKCTKILEIYINGNRMYAPDASQIQKKLNEIIYNANNPECDILCNAFSIHYDLIALQPFEDFNKRTARLIMNWNLIQNGYSPIVFNAPRDKQNYISAITANANGKHKEYNNYMLSAMARTQDNIIKVFKKSRIL